MSKFIDGFLEYRAEIPVYKKVLKKHLPRMIIIKDYSKINHWKIIISEMKPLFGDIKQLDFNPPKNLRELIEN